MNPYKQALLDLAERNPVMSPRQAAFVKDIMRQMQQKGDMQFNAVQRRIILNLAEDYLGPEYAIGIPSSHP